MHKCSICNGPSYYSGGCNGEWECWGECDKDEPPKDIIDDDVKK